MGAIKKAGVEFFAKIDTNRDLIGKASEFTAEVIVDADGSVLTDADANASIGAFTEVGSTGIYRAPITLTDEGDFTISVKWTDTDDTTKHEYIPFPVEVKSADMSDIKALIDALQTDMTSVKGQVDTLDEAELNNIAEQVTTLASHVETIEGLLDGDDNASLNVLKSLIEDISNSGLDSISTFVDNLELMLEGKEYTDTEGNVITEADSKGLAEIFAAIVQNGTDIATANTAITDLDGDVAALKTSIEDKIAAVSTKIDDFKTSVEAKVDAVKTVVDANKASLEDAGYGLDALKTLIETCDTAVDTLVTDFADGGRLEVRFDDIDSAIAAATNTIITAISDQTGTLEGRFDTVDAALASMAATQSYKGFV